MTMLARVWCRSLYVHVTCVRQGQRTTRGATSQATGFRGSPRAQRESRYSPSSKGVRGPSGLRPARPAVNIHSFIKMTYARLPLLAMRKTGQEAKSSPRALKRGRARARMAHHDTRARHIRLYRGEIEFREL